MSFGLNDWANEGEDGEENEDLAVVANEQLDISAETMQLDGLIMGLEDLRNLGEEIAAAGGMCKSYAEEALRLDPQFAGGVPLAYYSERPTATRFKASLEALSFSIGAMIAAGIAVLMTIIVKIIGWVFGDSGGGGGGGKTAKDLVEATDKALETVAEVARIKKENIGDVIKGISDVNHFMAGTPCVFKTKSGMVTFKSIDDIINWHDLAWFKEHNLQSPMETFEAFNPALFDDVFKAGPYTKMVSSFASSVKKVVVTLKEKSDSANDLLLNVNRVLKSSDRKLDNDALNNKEGVPELLKEIGGSEEEIRARFGMITSDVKIDFNGSQISLEEALSKLNAQRQTLQDSEVKNHYSIGAICHNLLALQTRDDWFEICNNLQDTANLMRFIETAMEKLEAALPSPASASVNGTNEATTPEVARAIQSILHAMRQNLVAVKNIDLVLNGFYEIFARAIRDAENTLINAVRRALGMIMAIMMRGGNVELVEENLVKSYKANEHLFRELGEQLSTLDEVKFEVATTLVKSLKRRKNNKTRGSLDVADYLKNRNK